MILGFCGMSYFSTASSEASSSTMSDNNQHTLLPLQEPLLSTQQQYSITPKKLDDESSSDSDEDTTDATGMTTTTPPHTTQHHQQRTPPRIRKRTTASPHSLGASWVMSLLADVETGDLLLSEIGGGSDNNIPPNTSPTTPTWNSNSSISNDLDTPKPTMATPTATVSPMFICGREVSQFSAGLIVAVCGGVWGGSVLIPMKLCHQTTSGPAYLMSFSTGATLVTGVVWILRFLYHVVLVAKQSQGQQPGQPRESLATCFHQGYQALPSFYLQEMWLPGGLSGLLWSTGNFFSILSVHSLGAGVGFCVVQASMLVGGVWGIFYFQEIPIFPEPRVSNSISYFRKSIFSDSASLNDLAPERASTYFLTRS